MASTAIVRSRPISYSEGYIVPILSPPPSPQPNNTVPFLILSPESPDKDKDKDKFQLPSIDVVFHLALRFSLHIALISLFETVFFWVFVSKQESTALEKVMDTYTSTLFSNCSSLSIDQRIILIDLVNYLVNSTQVESVARNTQITRYLFNDILLRNSWLYVGGLTTLFGGLIGIATVRRIRIQWAQILGENAAMILLLGLYEWMFFHTIVLQYQAISSSELNQRIANTFYQECRLLLLT